MPEGSSPRCLVRGSINIDEFFHLPYIVRPGETISSTHLTRGAGGKGANQANAVARAGGSVVLDGCIGNDGIWVKDGLEKAGVDVGRVKVVESEVTGRAIIQIAEDGENSIVLHKGANHHIPKSDCSPDVNGFTHLLLQNEIPITSTFAYLRTASTASITTIFNPSPMPPPSTLQGFPWECLSWLIVNEGELKDLLKAVGEDDESSGAQGSFYSQNGEAMMIAFRKGEGKENVGLICTLGARGILYYPVGAKKVAYLQAAKVLNGVKDTTGAGDCFAGYFAAGLMRDEDLRTTLKTCLTACAMCVEKPGAMDSVPTRSEVEQRKNA